MIRVTIDLIPYGEQDLAKTLHTITIKNIGGDEEIASYIAEMKDKTYLIEKFEKKQGALVLLMIMLTKIIEKLEKKK